MLEDAVCWRREAEMRHCRPELLLEDIVPHGRH
jgi:hypothetical protein